MPDPAEPTTTSAWPTWIEHLRTTAAQLPRSVKRLTMIAFDVIVLLTILWMILSIRFDRFFIPNVEQGIILMSAPLIAIPIFIRLGLYRSVIRYLPSRAVWTITKAMTIASLLWVTLAFMTSTTGAEGIPRSVPLAYWAIATSTIVASRFFAKRLLWARPRADLLSNQTLIYGTGDAATQLASALRSTNERLVCGFVSDDPTLHGMDIMGIRVYPPRDVPLLVSNFGVKEVIIAAAASAAKQRNLLATIGNSSVKVRILPPIADLAAGKHVVNSLRHIDIDDLLGRLEIPSNPTLLRSPIEGQVIMITGAAGSIGSALTKTVAGLNPAKLVLLDVNEHGLYQISREISRNAHFPVVSVLGATGEMALVEDTIKLQQVQTIYHCAAYKHVGLVENNVLEGVRNNVFGTEVLAGCAFRQGVKNFILISSDKAVRPTSVMGASKRWAELIVQHYGDLSVARQTNQNFASVRFGNVIGSSGSVVPLFREQIASGNPVTVTDEQMTRYFMSVREAAELIVQASALSTSGDTLLLEMGEPVRIFDLAVAMILLAGLTVRDDANPDGDIEIKIVGALKGEKLHEELFYDPTSVIPTSHSKILRARLQDGRSAAEAPNMIEKLVEALARRDVAAVRHVLFSYVGL